MSENLRVGFVGAGRMGRPMCGHIMKAGFPVTVYDPVAASVQAVVHQGGLAAASPREVAEASDVTVVMPGFYDQVLVAIAGPDGLLEGASKGDVIVVASTVAPDEAKELGALCEEKGVHFLDAPVTQGERGAEEAYLLWLVGGDEEVLQRVRPVLETCGTDIHRLGPIGSGMVGKAINNMLLWAALVADKEALAIAERHGVSEEVLIPALLKSSGTNWPLEKWHDMHRIPWAHKDMIIVLQMADQARLTVPLAGLLREQVKPLMAAAGVPDDLIR